MYEIENMSIYYTYCPEFDSKEFLGVYSKFGGNAYPYMDQTWNIIQCQINPDTHQVIGVLPEEAVGYYLEIKTLIHGEEFVVTSGYTVID